MLWLLVVVVCSKQQSPNGACLSCTLLPSVVFTFLPLSPLLPLSSRLMYALLSPLEYNNSLSHVCSHIYDQYFRGSITSDKTFDTISLFSILVRYKITSTVPRGLRGLLSLTFVAFPVNKWNSVHTSHNGRTRSVGRSLAFCLYLFTLGY
jgi:hypothetical protein